MSAATNLAGLYPPIGRQIWNENLMWQPIPVHVIPNEMDSMIYPLRDCPAYETLYDRLMDSSEFKAIEKKYDYLYKFLTEKTGEPIDTLWKADAIYDTLMIQSWNNKT